MKFNFILLSSLDTFLLCWFIPYIFRFIKIDSVCFLSFQVRLLFFFDQMRQRLQAISKIKNKCKKCFTKHKTKKRTQRAKSRRKNGNIIPFIEWEIFRKHFKLTEGVNVIIRFDMHVTNYRTWSDYTYQCISVQYNTIFCASVEKERMCVWKRWKERVILFYWQC